jgi:ABC-type branched-subunit amino acid transport system permease subunit
MHISENQKLDILINLLNERYNASHKIRERSLRFTIWVLGLAVALIWILINESLLTLSQKVILTILVITLEGVTFWFIYSLKSGFKKNREVMIKLEEALGCYQEGLYLESKAVYPNEYKNKKEKTRFSHFKSIYILLIPIAILIIFLIWLTPSEEGKSQSSSQTKYQLQIESQKAEGRR